MVARDVQEEEGGVDIEDGFLVDVLVLDVDPAQDVHADIGPEVEAPVEQLD